MNPLDMESFELEDFDNYLAHRDARKHKYLQKIGDRYFYTQKELQAFFNRGKAKIAGRIASNAARKAVKYGGLAIVEAATGGKKSARYEKLYNRYLKIAEKAEGIGLKGLKKANRAEAEKAARIMAREADVPLSQITIQETSAVELGAQWLRYNSFLAEHQQRLLLQASEESRRQAEEAAMLAQNEAFRLL